MKKFRHILEKYVPENAVDQVHDLIVENHVNLYIARKRKTKLGDFRPPQNGNPSKISVNHDLNPYSFLITFLHELAHQQVWALFKNKVRPHGAEWQQTYQRLLNPFLTTDVFPPEVLDKLTSPKKKIFASSTADVALSRQLKKHDSTRQLIILEDLPDNTLFHSGDNRIFRKLYKRRKNYLCLQISSKRKYVFSPMAEVIPIDEQDK